jgi:hypothetical protein
MAIGNSLFDEEGAKIVENLYTKAAEKNVQLHLPTGVNFINILRTTFSFELNGIS